MIIQLHLQSNTPSYSSYIHPSAAAFLVSIFMSSRRPATAALRYSLVFRIRLQATIVVCASPPPFPSPPPPFSFSIVVDISVSRRSRRSAFVS
ncbi:hypothetical protein DENSPDRAFT_167507 [Dentipellis sp. KUC8613]|nr:hypothetical protein DENSPDRAFT_167507 [Dentipellis sp. KUC8613]